MDEEREGFTLTAPFISNDVFGYNVYISHPTFQYRNPHWFWRMMHRILRRPLSRCGFWGDSYELVKEIRY